MGPPSYMRSVVDRNVVTRRVTARHNFLCSVIKLTREILRWKWQRQLFRFSNDTW